jgi:hypothetical protein
LAREPRFQLSLGSLLSQSFAVYLRNLIPFLLLGTVVFVPWIVLRYFAAQAGTADPRPIEVLLGMVQMLLAQLLAGALTYGVVQRLRGEAAGMGAQLSHGVSSFLRVLGTGLLSGLLIGLGMVLIVPGLIFAVRYYVAVPVAVMEGQAGSAAMARSKSLVDGSGWVVFGAFLVVVLMAAVLGGVVGAVLAFQPDGSVEKALQSMWFEVPITIFSNTFGATMMSVAYFQLRKGKENIDARQVANVFG